MMLCSSLDIMIDKYLSLIILIQICAYLKHTFYNVKQGENVIQMTILLNYNEHNDCRK